MPLVVYLDETGDHSLELIDRDFPIFGVVMFICDTQKYIQEIIPTACQLKFDYFGHEGVVLHSREIRRAQGEFGFLTGPAKRDPFYKRINQLMSLEYHLVASFIRKQRHKDRYGDHAIHPYELALEFTLERLLQLLENENQSDVQIVAESRGKREDDELRLSFLQVLNVGTDYVRSERFRKINFRLDFRSKGSNLIGTQIADLAAYPIARYILDKDTDNPAYEIIRRKVYKLKVFP